MFELSISDLYNHFLFCNFNALLKWTTTTWIVERCYLHKRYKLTISNTGCPLSFIFFIFAVKKEQDWDEIPSSKLKFKIPSSSIIKAYIIWKSNVSIQKSISSFSCTFHFLFHFLLFFHHLFLWADDHFLMFVKAIIVRQQTNSIVLVLLQLLLKHQVNIISTPSTQNFFKNILLCVAFMLLIAASSQLSSLTSLSP